MTKMIDDLRCPFFGSEITVRFGTKEGDIVPVSVIDNKSSSAWARAFSYHESVGILDINKEKVDDLLVFYRKRKQKASSIVLWLFNAIVSIIRAIEHVIKSFLGSFFGFE